jgi:hypothetical protein
MVDFSHTCVLPSARITIKYFACARDCRSYDVCFSGLILFMGLTHSVILYIYGLISLCSAAYHALETVGLITRRAN